MGRGGMGGRIRPVRWRGWNLEKTAQTEEKNKRDMPFPLLYHLHSISSSKGLKEPSCLDTVHTSPCILLLHSLSLAYLQRGPGRGLLHGSLQRLQNLKRNLRLRNVLLTTTSTRNLLLLRDLVPHRLGAEVLEGEALDGVDGHDGTGLHDCEAAGYC